MSVATKAAGALAAATLGTMYLNAKHLIVNDIFSGALASLSKAPLQFLEERQAQGRMTVSNDLEERATNPTTSNNLFLIFERHSWTYSQFWTDVRKVARWLITDLNVQKHEIVAIDGSNSPEHIMMWFALETIAAVPAFINCNLTKEPLLHCIRLCDAKVCLVDSDIRNLVESVEEDLFRGVDGKPGCRVVYYSSEFVAGLPSASEQDLGEDRRKGLNIFDVGTLIYTSGTTGMPKGTILPRGKELNTARSVSLLLGLKPGNRMYSCLPLYHGAAHGLCITPSVFAGSTVVLSRKFSHKSFWSEVRDSQADILQYVGELCRYLINAPPSSLDRQHNVQMAWGNGMRPDVWDVFRERFGVDTINELYAATDGLGFCFNRNRGNFGRHAVAVRGSLWKLLNSNAEKRIKIDIVTQEIIRDADGFAIECQDGEPGETVHQLDEVKEKLIFAGYYNNENAGEKRKMHDLFRPGDRWLRSGDLMKQDPDGCLYFVDRLGDTFRWKSENVSTNEVGDVVGNYNEVAEANVYGVQVPFADGRCGCVAIVMVPGTQENQFDFSALARHCVNTLPRYAVPIFVRVVKELQYTGTMKVQKTQLREEGIDLEKISAGTTSDTMYWLAPGHTTYTPFTRRDWEELKGGRVKL